MGFVMLLLSVLTLPALMKFFTRTTGTIAGSGGGGQLLGMATMGAIAVGAMRGYGGGSPQDQAAYLDSRLGPPPGGSAGPPNGGPPPGPDGPGGSGPAPAPSGGASAEPSGQPAPWPQPGTSHSLGTSAPSGAADPTAPAANPPAASPAPASGAAAASTAAGPIAAATVGAQLVAETTGLANGAMDEGEQR